MKKLPMSIGLIRGRAPMMLASVLASSALAGCASDSQAPTRKSIDAVFWTLTTDIKAATIAVNGTQKLQATPRNSVGDALQGATGIVTFRSTDPTKVTVDSTGLVTGLVPGNVAVIASLTLDGTTLIDSTTVVVTAQRQAIKSFSIQPLPTDSTRLGINSSIPMRLTVKDSNDVTVFGAAASYRVNNRTSAYMQGSSLRGISPGTVDVIGSGTFYGVTMTDSVRYTVTYQKVAQVNLMASATPVTLFLGRNSMVTFSNFTMQPARIVFTQGVADIPGGDIPLVMIGMPQTRKFPTEGTYKWKNPDGVESGTITVLAD